MTTRFLLIYSHWILIVPSATNLLALACGMHVQPKSLVAPPRLLSTIPSRKTDQINYSLKKTDVLKFLVTVRPSSLGTSHLQGFLLNQPVAEIHDGHLCLDQIVTPACAQNQRSLHFSLKFFLTGFDPLIKKMQKDVEMSGLTPPLPLCTWRVSLLNQIPASQVARTPCAAHCLWC